MPRVILYIAASLDGFIASEDGDVSWLDAYSGDIEDYGYSEFFSGIDAIVKGSTTYEQVLGFGAWPYGDKPALVFTKRDLSIPEGANITLYAGGPRELLAIPSRRGEKRIWLLGGASLAGSFLQQNLVDEIILSIVPLFLDGGIRLFGRSGGETRLELLKSPSYATGVVQLHYRVARPPIPPGSSIRRIAPPSKDINVPSPILYQQFTPSRRRIR